jgi:S1-C subfamily serine protease
MKRILIAIAVLLFISGCATAYDSLRSSDSGKYELIIAQEQEVSTAAFEAISRIFPTANIIPLTGYQMGFAWYHQPFLDHTDFKFLLASKSGISDEGTEISGFTYSIATQGSHFFVNERWVGPLIEEFKRVLIERGIALVYVGNLVPKPPAEEGKIRSSGRIKTGTGFFVTRNGHLVTSYHVIKGASRIILILADGERVAASLVKSDSVNDIALIRAEISSIPLTVGSATEVPRGRDVVTLGYPLVGIQGQEQKATFGRVNALSGIKGDIRFLQIDVPIQPGNSGGPLIEMNGKVIGLITSTLNPVGTLRATGALPQNVNYALKSDYLFPLFTGLDLIREDEAGTQELPSIIKRFEKSVVLVLVEY